MADMTPADIAAVTNRDYCYNDGFGMGGSGLWFLAILFLLGGGGFGGWSNRGNVATTEDLASGFNFSGVNNKLNEITAGIAGVNQNLSNAICQLGYQGAQHTYELGSKIDNCCCQTQRAVDSVKFDMANYAAAINANFNDKFAALEKSQLMQTINSMAATIQDLQLDKRFCGVPKIQPATVYGAVPYNGYCGGYGCGYGNI